MPNCENSISFFSAATVPCTQHRHKPQLTEIHNQYTYLQPLLRLRSIQPSFLHQSPERRIIQIINMALPSPLAIASLYDTKVTLKILQSTCLQLI